MAKKIKDSFSKQLILLALEKLELGTDKTSIAELTRLSGVRRNTLDHILVGTAKELGFARALKILAVMGISGEDILNLAKESKEISKVDSVKITDKKIEVTNDWTNL